MPKNKEDTDIVIPKSDTKPGPGLVSLSKEALEDMTPPGAAHNTNNIDG